MSREKTLALRKNVKPFENSELKKSIIQLINTVPPFFILWFLAYQSLGISVWLTSLFQLLQQDLSFGRSSFSMIARTVHSSKIKKQMILLVPLPGFLHYLLMKSGNVNTTFTMQQVEISISVVPVTFGS